jgi:hypothetical protein
LPCVLHSIHIDIRLKLFFYCLDIRCVYLILSLFPTVGIGTKRRKGGEELGTRTIQTDKTRGKFGFLSHKF